MRDDWNVKRLGEVCQFINGRAYSKNELLSKGKYPVLRVGNFFTNNQWYFSDLELEKDKYCQEGDLLYAWSASFGPRIWQGDKVIYHYHIWKVVPDTSLVSKEFLFRLLEWDTEALKSAHGTGTTMMHVGKGSIEKRLVPIPPLSEQHRIVSILDSAFAAIDKAKANAEKNLQNAKELFESYLQGVFEKKGEGWEKATLGEVCLFKGGGTPSTKVKKYWEGSIPWVSPKDMKSKVIVDSQDHVSEVALQNCTISLIPKMSVLVVVRSGILSRIVPLGISERELTINQDLKALCPGKKIDSRFLFYFLESNMKLLLSKVSRGATVHRLTTDSLRDLIIYLPPLREQKSIVEKVDMIYSMTEELKSKFQRKSEDMDELKRAILQKAFNGELKTTVKELA